MEVQLYEDDHQDGHRDRKAPVPRGQQPRHGVLEAREETETGSMRTAQGQVRLEDGLQARDERRVAGRGKPHQQAPPEDEREAAAQVVPEEAGEGTHGLQRNGTRGGTGHSTVTLTRLLGSSTESSRLPLGMEAARSVRFARSTPRLRAWRTWLSLR